MVSINYELSFNRFGYKLLIHNYLILIAIYVLLLTKSEISANRRSVVENFASHAFEHGVRVREEGACRNAKPQIVYINTTDPSKVYLPRATILHRCSDLTGCCPHATQTCQPIEMTTVELYFFTVTLQINHTHKSRQSRVRQHQKIEKLLFTNHTLCGCRRRNSNESIDNEV
jgi:hypothetical protein